jgi:hypothetical protein
LVKKIIIVKNATAYTWDWYCHLVVDRASLSPFCFVLLLPSVAIKPIMQSVLNLNVVMQSIIMLSVIPLSVMAPHFTEYLTDRNSGLPIRIFDGNQALRALLLLVLVVGIGILLGPGVGPRNIFFVTNPEDKQAGGWINFVIGNIASPGFIHKTNENHNWS